MLTYRCAWRNCEATCTDPVRLPADWIAFATFRKTRVPGVLDFAIDPVLRDALLCPEHNAALEALLFPI